MAENIQIVVLCGGKGTRLEGMDLPKPLCTVKGRSLLWHVLEGLPKDIKTVTIFYSEKLQSVQFERIVKHSCHTLQKLEFQMIPMETRGPVETSYIGLHRGVLQKDKPILFIDNDTINTFSLSNIPHDKLSIGVQETQDRSKPYSFLEVDAATQRVISIKEKQGISTTYSTGLYYFPTVQLYTDLCDHLFRSQATQKEFFLSDVYTVALELGHAVQVFPCEESIALGTHSDIMANIDKVRCHPMRICFDIDNTILTYSEEIGNTDGIEPIPNMVNIIKKLHTDGHTIVLHTARGMKSSGSNLGKAAKKSLLNVLQTLESYEIPYDEIYFGKPWADLYVDDKAWNPYTNPSFSEFLFDYVNDTTKLHIAKGCSNNENILYHRGNVLTKNGPTSSLEGEIYFYKMIKGTALASVCPTFFSSTSSDKISSLDIEYIEGRTVSSVFRNGLMTKGIMEAAVNAIRAFHASAEFERDGEVTCNDILENYLGKLNERAANHPHYNLKKLSDVLSIINRVITEYVNGPDFHLTHVVHGDSWFDNMLYDSRTQKVKLLDMKGKIGKVFSLKGDKMTDYAKLYQSVLGFDYMLYNERYPEAYEEQCRRWLSEFLPSPLDDPIFEAVTACCILKTFSYFSKAGPIERIYKSLQRLKLFSTIDWS